MREQKLAWVLPRPFLLFFFQAAVIFPQEASVSALLPDKGRVLFFRQEAHKNYDFSGREVHVLFRDDFVLEKEAQVSVSSGKKLWRVAVRDASCRAKSIEEPSLFVGEEIEERVSKNPFEEYYITEITEDEQEHLFRVRLLGGKNIFLPQEEAQPFFKGVFALDDLLPLKDNIVTTVRELLQQAAPKSLVSYNFLQHRVGKDWFNVLEKVEVFEGYRIASVGAKKNRGNKEKVYLVKCFDNQSTHGSNMARFFLLDNVKNRISLRACKRFGKNNHPEMIKVSLETLLAKKDFYHVVVKGVKTGELLSLQEWRLPFYTLLMAEDGRHYALVYWPIYELNEEEKPLLAKDVITSIKKTATPVPIKVLDSEGNLLRKNFSYEQLLAVSQ